MDTKINKSDNLKWIKTGVISVLLIFWLSGGVFATAPGYCSSSGGSHEFEYISSVTYAKTPESNTMTITVNIYIANPTGCIYGKSCPAYDNSPEYINVWIDWNGDKTFDNSEKVADDALVGYININYQGTMTSSKIVTIPDNAVSSTYMRANLGWGHDPNNPCESSWTWGDVVDKEVEIKNNIKVVQLDALDDIKIRNDDGSSITDPVWKKQFDVDGNLVDVSPQENDPIADDMQSAKFKIKATLNASPSKPDWAPKVDYSWTVDTSSGSGSFTRWVDDFEVVSPQKVGKYTLNLKFTIKDNNDNIIGNQEIDRILYVTYKNPNDISLFPKKRWLDVATDWGNGAKTAEQVTKNVVDKEYSNPFSWVYYDNGTDWEKMIDTTPGDKANCFVFAIVWERLTNVLGLNSVIAPTYSPGVHFITSTKKALDNNNDANARNKATGNRDRWHFGSHSVGRFNGAYYDPTFGLSEYTDEEKNVDYKNTGRTVSEWELSLPPLKEYKIYQSPRDPTKEVKVRKTSRKTPNKSWTIHEYKNPSLQSNSSSGAIFTGNVTDFGLDTDGDGLFNYLMVNIEINVTEDDNYSIDAILKFENRSISIGSLSLGLGINFSTPDDILFMDTGTHEISLYFSGRDIYEAGKNGNYTVDIILIRNDSQTDAELFNTSFYNYSQFQGLTLDVVNITDFGSDVNGDGRFDQLVVKVDLDVRRDAFYEIRGFLLGGGEQIDSTSNSSNLTKGNKTVFINFDVSKIRSSRVNGPYNLELFLADENYNRIVSYNTFQYDYTQFQMPLAWFIDNYSDYGTDTDSDGFYDYLSINVSVNVTSHSNYTILGWLSDSNGDDITWAMNKKVLSEGINQITLNFDGITIYNHGVNGPYNISYLALYDENGTLIDYLYDAYTTSIYNRSDFQKPHTPLVKLTGNYSDYGTDTNNNSLFEYLTVDVGVNVSNSGYCVISARILDNNGTEITWATSTTYLNATQTQIISLNFEGYSIFNNGVNGPYNIRDVYIYHTGDPTLSDYIYNAHTTAPYNYTQFENTTTEYCSANDNCSSGEFCNSSNICQGKFAGETNCLYDYECSSGSCYNGKCKPYCGDGECNAHESCYSCSQDCGTCSSGGGGGGYHEIKITAVQDVSVKAGETAKVNVTMKNTGEYQESNLHVSVLGLPSDWIAKTVDISELKRGEDKTITLEIVMPKNVVPTTYRLRARVDNKDSDEKEFKITVLPECTKDGECGDQQYCKNNICKNKKALGEKCEDDKECTSSLCIDICIKCKKDSDCPEGKECKNNSCFEKVIVIVTSKEEAEGAINKASSAISEAGTAINKAKSEGKKTENAEIKLNEAKDKLNAANASFKAEDYKNAKKDAEDATNKANEATKLIEETGTPIKVLNVSAPEKADIGGEVVIKVTSNGNPVDTADVKVEGKTYKTDADGVLKVKFDKEGLKAIEISKEGYESKTLTIEVQKEKVVDNTWLWVLGVLIIIGLILFLVSRRKKSK